MSSEMNKPKFKRYNPKRVLLTVVVMIGVICLLERIQYVHNKNSFRGVIKVKDKFIHERDLRLVICDTKGIARYLGCSSASNLEIVELDIKTHIGKCYDITSNYKVIYSIKDVTCENENSIR